MKFQVILLGYQNRAIFMTCAAVAMWMSTGELLHVALLGVAGSYWRADKNKQQLQRITGTAFWSKQELDDFLQNRADAINFDLETW